MLTGPVTVSEAPTTGLGKLLTENRFFVPTHQRDYRWDEDRVRKLFDDLVEAMERGDSFYFIGLMVFMRSSDDRLRVLDGQQRLATAIIIFSALRAWFGRIESDSDTAPNLQRDFIGRSEYGDIKVRPKLSFNLNNDERFQRYVVSGSPLSDIKKERLALSKYAPNADLLAAILYCHERVGQLASELSSEAEAKTYFTNFIKFIRDSVVVVRLTVPSEANAFRVFETLNDRGLDLSAVDLIKNYLFGIAHDKSANLLHDIENRWSQLTQELTDVKEADFLRVYWTSRYGRTQLDDIFEAVRATVKTSDDAQRLTVDLLQAAEHYVAVESPGDAVWTRYSEKTKVHLLSLGVLDSKQVRPVLLAAIKRFSAEEFERLVWLLEVVVVRWQLIGGRRTGAIEIACARLAERIWNERVQTARGARDELNGIYTSDQEFREAFSVKEGLTNQKAAYVLKAIEMEERRRLSSKTAGDLQPGQFMTIEHILPKNPGDEWRAETTTDPNLVSECALRNRQCLLAH